MSWPTHISAVFDEGKGYAIVVAIHKAIKQRWEAVGSPAQYNTTFPFGLSSDQLSDRYTEEWPGGTIWLEDSPNAPDSRVYLNDVLIQFYEDIETLITAFPRWAKVAGTNGAVGSGTAWTLAELETAIGLGNFYDLLTGAENSQPLTWLVEALDRLIYPTVTAGLSARPQTQRARTSRPESEPPYTSYFSAQAAWDNRDAGPLSTYGYREISWRVSGSGASHVARLIDEVTFYMDTSQYAGDVLGGAWFAYEEYGGSTAIGTIYNINGQNTSIGTVYSNNRYIEWDSVELSAGDDEQPIEMHFVTPEPTTWAGGKYVLARIRNARMYLDLTPILEDQAP